MSEASERASDVAQDSIGITVQIGKVLACVGVQGEQGIVMMVMGHLVAEGREHAFGGVCLGIVRWGVDQAEIVSVPLDHGAQLLRDPKRVDTEIIGEDHGHLAPLLRTLDKVIDLAPIRVSGASQRMPWESQPLRQWAATKPTTSALWPGARTRRWPW